MIRCVRNDKGQFDEVLTLLIYSRFVEGLANQANVLGIRKPQGVGRRQLFISVYDEEGAKPTVTV